MLTNGVDLKWLKTRSETLTQLTKVLQLTYNFVNKSSHVEWITYKIQLYGKNKTHLICRPSFDFFLELNCFFALFGFQENRKVESFIVLT